MKVNNFIMAYKARIVGYSTDHFVSHLCGGGGNKGLFYLFKFRVFNEDGLESCDENCCSIDKNGAISWYRYPSGEYLILMVADLEKLLDVCGAELNLL